MNKQKVLDVFLLAMALIIIFINAVGFESRKEGLFLDEKATFHIANASYTSVGNFWNRLSDDDFRILKTIWGTLDNAPMVVGERCSLSEVKSMLDAQEGDKFTVMGTLLLSWPDSHPPFYYLLFNAFNSLIPGVSPMHVGFIINILLFCLLASFYIKLYSTSLKTVYAAFLEFCFMDSAATLLIL